MFEWYVSLYALAWLVAVSIPKTVGDPLLISAGAFSLAGVALSKLGDFSWQLELSLALTTTLLLMGFLWAVRYARLKKIV